MNTFTFGRFLNSWSYIIIASLKINIYLKYLKYFMITDINYALSFMASEVMCSFTFHLNIHFLVVERHGVRIFRLMFQISPNLAEFVNNGNGAGVVTVSNFCITVIVKTLETSQLCKASFLVLSCNLFGYKLPVAIFGIT